MQVLTITYSLISIALAIFALNAWVLTILYFRHRRFDKIPPELRSYPKVTVQLPIYNEALVVERLLKSIVRLNYPRDQLQIQVLDDSSDETTALISLWIEHYQAQGIDIRLYHRDRRTGFKAGALKEGMEYATGEYIAIFDADFVPPPDFLLRTIPYLASDPGIGFVQTRWGHLNPDYSCLTLAQTIALDGHFAIEQIARQRSGLLMSFNGTAGVWRKACMLSAGGWNDDTICEDLDLSYRAQLIGWKSLFLPDVVTPAEVPPQLGAFKRQQYRWAKGSIQCLKKLIKTLLAADIPLAAKLEGSIHLSNYLIHPLLLLLSLLMLPLMLSAGKIHLPMTSLGLLSIGPPLLYLVALQSLYREWWKRYATMPLLVLLGWGIALNNTKAVIEAFLGINSEFRRTPKFCVERRNDLWRYRRYRLPLDAMSFGEIMMSIYSLATAAIAWRTGNSFAIPFILIYASGFGYVGFQGLWDAKCELKGGLMRLLGTVAKSKQPAPQQQFLGSQ